LDPHGTLQGPWAHARLVETIGINFGRLCHLAPESHWDQFWPFVSFGLRKPLLSTCLRNTNNDQHTFIFSPYTIYTIYTYIQKRTKPIYIYIYIPYLQYRQHIKYYKTIRLHLFLFPLYIYIYSIYFIYIIYGVYTQYLVYIYIYIDR
jgi:hypothetical protein